MIAALYVETGGCYFGLDNVDPWDVERDARLYDGPHPVVAHPPCKRWGRYARGGPSATPGKFKLGDDHGCFAAALASVRKWGGVIEHPEASHAWHAHNLNKPPRWGGWIAADFYGGWTCCVEQGHYGHLARKATWLYVFGVSDLPNLIWGPSEAKMRLDDGFHSAEERQKSKGKIRKHWVIDGRMPKHLRLGTPEPFRDLLLNIAKGARP